MLRKELLAATPGLSEESILLRLLSSVTQLTISWQALCESHAFVPGCAIRSLRPGRIDTEWGGDVLSEYIDKKVKLMVVVDYPWMFASTGSPRYCSATLADQLLDVLRPLHSEIGLNTVWLTHAVRFFPGKQVRAQYSTISKDILQREIDILQPERILALGSAGGKMLLGRNFPMSTVRANTNLDYAGTPLYVSISPNSIDKRPEMRLPWEDDIKRIISWCRESPHEEQSKKTYLYLDTVDQVLSAIEFIRARNADRPEGYWLALDCEWGRHSGVDLPENNELRCIQLSDRPHFGIVIRLATVGLEPVIPKEDHHRVYSALNGFLGDPRVFLVGHNLRSDLHMLRMRGVNCVHRYMFDTMTAFHTLEPQAEGKALEDLSIKYTDLGRYDAEIEMWKTRNKMGKDIKRHGYANVPDDILLPYSAKDVDAVQQALPHLISGLQSCELSERFRGYTLDGGKTRVNNMYDMYMALHVSEHAVFECESEGLPVDFDRMMRMQSVFSARDGELLAQVREMLGWPEFNPDGDDLAHYLYGVRGLKKRARENASLPDGVECLNLKPVLTTGKYPKPWDDLSPAEEAKAMPACSADALEILKTENPDVAETLDLILDYKTVNQVVKNFLPRPCGYDGNGEPLWDSGWIGHMVTKGYRDYRVKSHFLATTNTGRYRSFKVNVNNLSNTSNLRIYQAMAPDKQKLLATKGWTGMPTDELKALGLIPTDLYNLRSFLRAVPGRLWVGFDYSQAELFTISGLSKDENMLAAMFDPDVDIHSSTAVSAFRLSPPEGTKNLKKWLKETNNTHLRSAAKSIIFGILYQRSASGIRRQLQAAGIDISLDESQKMIDDIYSIYPGVRNYVDEMKWMRKHKGYVENPFGFRRYFPSTNSRSEQSRQDRQAVNAPIQSSVAGLIQFAFRNLYMGRERAGLSFRMLMPLHDCIYTLIPVHELEPTFEFVVKAMSKDAYIPNIGFEGDPGLFIPTDPEPYFYWEEKGDLPDLIHMSLNAN